MRWVRDTAGVTVPCAPSHRFVCRLLLATTVGWRYGLRTCLGGVVGHRTTCCCCCCPRRWVHGRRIAVRGRTRACMLRQDC